MLANAFPSQSSAAPLCVLLWRVRLHLGCGSKLSAAASPAIRCLQQERWCRPEPRSWYASRVEFVCQLVTGTMRWNDINAELRSLKTAGRDVELNGVHYDSRRVGAGDVFVAMRGGSTDGNRFVDAALQQGAAAIVTDSSEIFDRLRSDHPSLPIALVEHGRRALAEVSAAVFGHPERQLKLS